MIRRHGYFSTNDYIILGNEYKHDSSSNTGITDRDGSYTYDSFSSNGMFDCLIVFLFFFRARHRSMSNSTKTDSQRTSSNHASLKTCSSCCMLFPANMSSQDILLHENKHANR
jgi:hypothetical protein